MERGKPIGLKKDGQDQPPHCLAHEQQGLPHLASSLLGHMVAVSGLQLLLLAGRPVLPGQVPHSSLVLEFPALVAAQLHVPEEDLLISQLRFQVLQLFPLPLCQVFSARLLPELRDLGQEGQSNPYPTGAATHKRSVGNSKEGRSETFDTSCFRFASSPGDRKSLILFTNTMT